MADELIQSEDQLTGQRFVEQDIYDADPRLNAAIKQQVRSSRYTVASLKVSELKRILKLYDIPNRKILAADTNQKLVELAFANGIVDVPDQWTLDQLRSEQRERQAKESFARTHLSAFRAE